MTRTAIVTGANRARGIGLAMVRELRARGEGPVVGTYRDPSRSSALLELADSDDGVLCAALDVSSDSSVDAFARWCREHVEKVDLLVNNAGNSSPTGSIVTTPLAELEAAVQVHAVGMLRVTRALLPLMAAGSVVVNVSSNLGSIAGMGRQAAFYAPAKAFQNALSVQLADTLRPDGIVVYSASPGWVATDMGGTGAPLTPERSAAQLVDHMLAADISITGSFRGLDGREITW